MKALNEVEWGSFMLGDIFNIKPGKRLTKSRMCDGRRPFIGASDSNNGVTAFVSNDNNSIDCNVLGVNYNGSVVENFYHPYECIFSDDVKRFSFKHHKGNKYLYLFVKQLILMQKSKYQYGYKFNELRMNKQIILLPITKEGNPDYVYMEEYMKEKERVIILQYKKYLSQLIENQQVAKRGGVDLKKIIEWRSFMLGELFNFEKGNQNNMSQLSCGLIPLVSAKKNDNGYKEFVLKNTKKSFKGESLTINNDGDGGAGIAYYQPFDYLLDSHVTALYPRQKINKYTMLFISNCITLQRSKFGHGYPITFGRLNTFRCMLPVTSDGKPDYAYMEAYMQNKEIECLKQYVDYLENQLN